MIARLRLLLAVARPSVVVLMVLFVLVGAAQAGGIVDPDPTLAVALVAVLGYLVSSVAVNDLADVAIDRVNLPDDASRLLVAGRAHRRLLVVVAGGAATVAVGSALAISPWAGFTVTVGLALAAAYSLPPVRVADRGAVASLLLPAGYVAVPFLVGLLSVRSAVTGRDLALLGALYVGFIGRIVLKDFRDVRGDALFGKRTFLVRHGRRATCRLSAACWVAGGVVVLAVRGTGPVLGVAVVAIVVSAVGLLRRLGSEAGPRRDEALISALALLGRGTVVTLVGHLAMVDLGWRPAPQAAGVVAFAVITLAQGRSMARYGPRVALAGLGDVEAELLAGQAPQVGHRRALGDQAVAQRT